MNMFTQAAEHLPVSVRHEVEVTAVRGTLSRRLDVEADGGSVEVTLAEDWAPYAQVKVTIPAPSDETLLDELLDPRRNCRLHVRAGYTYPDNITEMGLLADVGLRERPLSRPADTLALDGGSAEYRAQDYRALYWEGMERAGITEAVSWLAGFAEAAPRIRSDFPARHGAAQLAEIEVNLGDDYWSLMADAAVRTNTRVWCDETGEWRVAARVDHVSAPVHRMAVGAGGTITGSTANLSRDEWFNSVLLEYRWSDQDGNQHIVYGRALAVSGPFAVAAVGHKTHHERIERPISQATADRAAAAKLRTLISRGRSRVLTGGAAYWMRPSDTVSVLLPTGDEELAVVQSVRFTPLNGLMQVTTREPLDVQITNGE